MSPDGAHMGDSRDLTTESVSDNLPVPTHMQAMMRLVANHLGDPHRSSVMFQKTMRQVKLRTVWGVKQATTMKTVLSDHSTQEVLFFTQVGDCKKPSQ